MGNELVTPLAESSKQVDCRGIHRGIIATLYTSLGLKCCDKDISIQCEAASGLHSLEKHDSFLGSSLVAYVGQFDLKDSSLLDHVSGVIQNPQVSVHSCNVDHDIGPIPLILCDANRETSFAHGNHMLGNLLNKGVLAPRRSLLGHKSLVLDDSLVKGLVNLGLYPWLHHPFDPGTLVGWKRSCLGLCLSFLDDYIIPILCNFQTTCFMVKIKDCWLNFKSVLPRQDVFTLDSFLYYLFTYNDYHANFEFVLCSGRKFGGWFSCLHDGDMWLRWILRSIVALYLMRSFVEVMKQMYLMVPKIKLVLSFGYSKSIKTIVVSLSRDIFQSHFLCAIHAKLFMSHTKDPWVYSKCEQPWIDDICDSFGCTPLSLMFILSMSLVMFVVRANLRTNSFQDGEEDTGIMGSRPITRSQARELQRLQDTFIKMDVLDHVLEPPKGVYALTYAFWYHGVFMNSTLQSFLGNKGLCGVHILEVPACTIPGLQSKSKELVLKVVIPVVISFFLIFLSVSIWIIKRQKKGKSKDVEKVPDIRTHQLVSYHEIQRATNYFDESNLIGVGSSGTVYKGTLSSGIVVAIKILDLEYDEVCKRFDTECEVMRNVRHRNLVPVITTCSSDYIRAFVLQYMSNGSLEYWLYREDCQLNLLQSVTVMLDAAMGIEYLHHGHITPVAHCDLKPDNILLDEDMVAHVGDFGISKILAVSKSMAYTETLGTLGYIAPEYGSEGIVSTNGDVYSYGIMLMEVLTKRRPTDEDICNENLDLRKWITQSFSGTMLDIVDGNLFPKEEQITSKSEICIASMIELALDCTKETPESRITMKDVAKRLNKIKNTFLER
ncbi:putative LRR receptor-like serine/threonine-protein kinase FLS2-like [Capsicum annuum]|nr:putative LRR receptor-like serine/threonine-protein kinase FLS2-like [Capsicum annuum]